MSEAVYAIKFGRDWEIAVLTDVTGFTHVEKFANGRPFWMRLNTEFLCFEGEEQSRVLLEGKP